MSNWLDRIGNPDADSLVSLVAKLGNNTTAFWTAIGYEGATSLAAKLTAARAALLDEITALRMAELDAANLPADVDTLLTRLSAARAGYLDELAAANIPADVDTLLARLTALRAGYLDELDFDLNARLGTPAGASLAADLLVIDNFVDDLESRLTAARAGYLDELVSTAIPADVDAIQQAVNGQPEIVQATFTGNLANTGSATLAALDAVGSTMRNIRVKVWISGAVAGAGITPSWHVTRNGALGTFVEQTIPSLGAQHAPAAAVVEDYGVFDLPDGLQGELRMASAGNDSALTYEASVTYEQ